MDYTQGYESIEEIQLQTVMNTVTQIHAILPALLRENDRRPCERSLAVEEDELRDWTNLPLVVCRSSIV